MGEERDTTSTSTNNHSKMVKLVGTVTILFAVVILLAWIIIFGLAAFMDKPLYTDNEHLVNLTVRIIGMDRAVNQNSSSWLFHVSDSRVSWKYPAGITVFAGVALCTIIYAIVKCFKPIPKSSTSQQNDSPVHERRPIRKKKNSRGPIEEIQV